MLPTHPGRRVEEARHCRTGTDERLHGLFSLRGKEQVDVPEVQAGDIAAVAKLADVSTGDTLAPKGKPVTVVFPDRRTVQGPTEDLGSGPLFTLIPPAGKGFEKIIINAKACLEVK